MSGITIFGFVIISVYLFILLKVVLFRFIDKIFLSEENHDGRRRSKFIVIVLNLKKAVKESTLIKKWYQHHENRRSMKIRKNILKNIGNRDASRINSFASRKSIDRDSFNESAKNLPISYSKTNTLKVKIPAISCN